MPDLWALDERQSDATCTVAMLRLVDVVVAQQTPTLSKAPQTLYWLAGLCFPGTVFL